MDLSVEMHFPPSIDAGAKSLIAALCDPLPSQRCDPDQALDHGFFAGFDLKALVSGDLSPPFIPTNVPNFGVHSSEIDQQPSVSETLRIQSMSIAKLNPWIGYTLLEKDFDPSVANTGAGGCCSVQ